MNTESLDDFFSDYWLKKFRWTKQHSSISIPFGIEDFEELLMKERVNYPQVKILGESGLIDPHFYTKTNERYFSSELDLEKLKKLSFSKKTIIINRLQNLHEGIRTLQNMLESVFGCEVNINAYYSQGPVEGLKAHFDYHHVFAIQLAGEKKWSLGPIVVDTPHNEFRTFPVKSPDFTDFITLREGEMLYMPPGLWHTVYTNNVSLHLTVGIHPPDWHTKIRQMINEALVKHPILRAALPFEIHNDRCEYRNNIAKEAGLLFDLIKQEVLKDEKGKQINKKEEKRFQLTRPVMLNKHECITRFSGLDSALNALWSQLEYPLALYLRGSVLEKPKFEPPWDIDIIAVCDHEIESQCYHNIRSYYEKTFPELPVLDITCLSLKELLNKEKSLLLHVLLHEQAFLIAGNDVRKLIPKPKYDEHIAIKLSSIYLDQFDKSLNKYMTNKRLEEKVERAYLKSLCKQVLRMITPLVMIKEGIFLRDLHVCQKYLKSWFYELDNYTQTIYGFINNEPTDYQLVMSACLKLKERLIHETK